MSNEIALLQANTLADVQRIGDIFAKSGMFDGVNTMEKAAIRIMAGQEIGIPPFASISGIHIIKGKPTIGSGLIAARIKGSGKYDYKVKQMDDKACIIEFFQGKENIGTSSFTIEEAKKAGTQNLDKFPRNMLFARAISNGVKWFCPDVFAGPVYVPEEMDSIVVDTPAIITTAQTPSGNTPEIKPKKVISEKQYTQLIGRIEKGELNALNDAKESLVLTDDQITSIAGIALQNAMPRIQAAEAGVLDIIRSYTLNDGRTSPYTEAEQQAINDAALPYWTILATPIDGGVIVEQIK